MYQKVRKIFSNVLSKVIFSNCKNEETSQRVASSLENLKFSVSKREICRFTKINYRK